MALMMLMIRRELMLSIRRRTDIFNPIYFFLLIIMLFPLGLGTDPYLLHRISPSIIWVAALLSTLLSLDRIFRDDFLDGSLEQLIVGAPSVTPIIFGKIVAHWIMTGIPLILISPICSLFLSMNTETWLATVLTLLVGTPVLSFIGAIGAALTLNLKRPSIVLGIIIIPLYLPVLIFSTSVIRSASLELPYSGLLAILGAMLMVSIMLSSIVIRFALKVSMN